MNSALLRLLKLPLPVYGTLLLGACSSTNVVNLEGSDDTTFKDLRLSYPVTKEDPNERVKFRYTSAKGDFTQDIADGKIVDFEDLQLVGPDQVQAITDISTASISYGRVDQTLRDNFFMSAFAGISRTNFEIDMESASGSSSSVRNKSFEVYVDLGIYYLPLPFLSAGLEAAFSRNLSLSGLTEWGAVARFRPSKHMEIIGGYRVYKYDYFTTDYDSGITVELNGPFIGLDIQF